MGGRLALEGYLTAVEAPFRLAAHGSWWLLPQTQTWRSWYQKVGCLLFIVLGTGRRTGEHIDLGKMTVCVSVVETL